MNKAINPKSKLVHIVGHDQSVEHIFRRQGYGISTGYEPNYGYIDMFVFTGGEDINPAMYGEKPIAGTRFNPRRDAEEITIHAAIPKNKPKVGICRGGQLLNVLSGGSMWQDVDHHAGGIHPMQDLRTNRYIHTTSLHHQMMIPAEDADIIAVANRSTSYARDGESRSLSTGVVNHWHDIEVLWYPRTKSLCFQGHPEYAAPPECVNYFFDLIDEFCS